MRNVYCEKPQQQQIIRVQISPYKKQSYLFAFIGSMRYDSVCFMIATSL